jgi:type II secretory pathway component PulJ
MNRHGFTLIEAIVSMIVGMVVLTLGINFLMTQTRSITVAEIRQDVAWNTRNVHKLLSRDIMQAGFHAAELDSVDVVSVEGDTLTIRFSETENIRYFTDENFVLHRGDNYISNGIRFFSSVENINGSVSVEIIFAADRAHPWLNNGQLLQKTFVWTFVPRNTYYHN